MDDVVPPLVDDVVPPLVYVAYAAKDKRLYEDLEKHLALLVDHSKIRLEHSQNIPLGRLVQKTREEKLIQAFLILFLVSTDFIDACKVEIDLALKLSKQANIRVIPLIMRSGYYKHAPFADLQSLSHSGSPLAEEPAKRDQAFSEVVRELDEIISLTKPHGLSQISLPALSKLLHSPDQSGGDAAYQSSLNMPSQRASSPTPPSGNVPTQPRHLSRRAMILALSALGVSIGTGIVAILNPPTGRPNSEPQKTPSSEQETKGATAGTTQGSTPGATSKPTQTVTDNLLKTYDSVQLDISVIAWSPDSKRIVSGSSTGTILMHDLTTEKVFRQQSVSNAVQPIAVQSIAWSPDGTKIACGCQDGNIQIWDASIEHLVATAGGASSEQQHCISWSPDSQKIVDSSPQIWVASTGKLFFTQEPPNTTLAVAWSPDGKSIASVDRSFTGDGTIVVNVWDAKTGEINKRYKDSNQQGGSPQLVSWSPGGQYIIAGNTTLKLSVWLVPEPTPISWYQDSSQDNFHLQNIVSWSPDSKSVATPHQGGIQIWNPANGTAISTIKGAEGVSAVAWSPDGTKIASVTNNNILQIWKAP